MRSFLCFLLFFLVYSCSCQNFAGIWTDFVDLGGYGGTLFICQEGNTINGAYSEIGIIYGEVDGNTATGQWVEVGATERDCAYGTFKWSLSSTGAYFTGFYTCEDYPRIEHDWKSSRVSIIKPNFNECAKLSDADDATIVGFWAQLNGGSKSICSSNSGFVSSYEYFSNNNNGTIPGYEITKPAFENIIAAGTTIEESKTGLSLLFVLADGTLGQFWWFALPGNDPDPRDRDDNNLHQYRRYTLTGTAEQTDCAENSNIRFVPDFYYIDDDDLSSDSNPANHLFITLPSFILFITSMFVLVY